MFLFCKKLNNCIRYRIFKIFGLIISFLFVSSCATVYNPITKREEKTLYTVEQEIALGRQVAKQIEKENETYEDNTVSRIGQLVAGNSDRPDIPYSFKVINLNEINAFALPGGFIYIYKGLLDIIDEQELAAVLGHEIGHVSARHGIKRIQSVFGYQLASVFAIVVFNNEDTETDMSQVQQIADTIFTLVSFGYSRKDEFQADRLGTIYTYRSGYNPRAMVNVLEKLGKQENSMMSATFLSTHPPIDDRINEVEVVIASIKRGENENCEDSN